MFTPIQYAGTEVKIELMFALVTHVLVTNKDFYFLISVLLETSKTDATARESVHVCKMSQVWFCAMQI